MNFPLGSIIDFIFKILKLFNFSNIDSDFFENPCKCSINSSSLFLPFLAANCESGTSMYRKPLFLNTLEIFPKNCFGLFTCSKTLFKETTSYFDLRFLLL